MSGFLRKEENSAELQCKVILVGDAGVGKTCFLKKFVDGILLLFISFFFKFSILGL